ncbi:MAG: PA14 domain-containing protein [Chloroflexi bacterium]|nr:PA14 domain-containing protein [Chloroflexota bacterium]MDA8189517.1 PA14 domain-containing protein [Dehalococcoidales bacterium]
MGGNFWSNWTSPDSKNQGFVDFPYVFTGGQDNLPWVKENAWIGWYGEYFANMSLSGSPVLTRTDTSIDFDWGTGSPSVLVPAQEFSVRWTRMLTFTEGMYRFHTTGDDGIRLWGDGVLAIDDWSNHSAREDTADVFMTAGQHNLKVEYFEWIVYAVAKAWWEVAN